MPAQHQRLGVAVQLGHFPGPRRRFDLPRSGIERHTFVENRAVVVHGPNGLADDAQQNDSRRVEMKNRFDVGTSFVDRLVQGRLWHGLFEVDKEQFLALDDGWTLARHEHHLVALVAAQAEMSEGVAQSLPKNYPQRRDE